MNENIWSISFKDFFTAKMLKLAVVPIIATFFVLMFTVFSGVTAGVESLQNSTVQIEQSHTYEENGVTHTDQDKTELSGSSAIIGFLTKYAITSWLFGLFAGSVLFIAVVYLTIPLALVIIGFLTPFIVKEVHRRHYSHLPLDQHGSLFGILLATVKHVVIMVLLFMVLMPLYLIPLVNIIAFNIPFYYLFHKLYLLDVSSETTTKERFKLIMAFHGGTVRMTTFTLYVIALVPFAAAITPVFNVIVLTHTVLRKMVEVEAHHESVAAAKSAAGTLPNGSRDVLPS